MKTLIEVLEFIQDNGWLGIFTLFIPVTWKQDIYFKNNGKDLWHFKNDNNGYFYGTYSQKNKSWNYENKD
jgi:hypothetical protein